MPCGFCRDLTQAWAVTSAHLCGTSRTPRSAGWVARAVFQPALLPTRAPVWAAGPAVRLQDEGARGAQLTRCPAGTR